jgi:ribosome modulation factor
MPSALRASRAYVSRALASIRAGLGEYDRQLGQQGAEIKVEPFDAHNVSTPAALIKLGTSIAAARRHKANLEAAQQDVELEREKTRAEIAHLRAEAAYNLGKGRQTGAAGGTKEITPYQKATLGLSERRLGLSERSEAERTRRMGRVTSAQAALRQIDAQVARDTEEGTARQMNAHRAAIEPRINSTDPDVRNYALDALGISADDFEGATNPAQRIAAVNKGFENLRAKVAARARLNAEMRYRPQRQRWLDVISQGAENAFDTGEPAGEAPPEQGVVDLVVDENGNLVPAQ